ncbi:MAG TPA: c-type cytochrome [Chryseolinea sp.]
MKKSLIAASLLTASVFMGCQPERKQTAAASDEYEIADTPKPVPVPTKDELIQRGKYLVTVGGCNDCHSPKVMTDHGPAPDPTLLLSGHQRKEKLPPMGKNAGKNGWVLFSMNTTAFVGPWGLSYAANLTPDDTGIGAWSFENFLTAIRKGKSKGQEGNRDLLPPMPWPMYANMTDEDLLAVFTYLKSIPPVENLVPTPVPPTEL